MTTGMRDPFAPFAAATPDRPFVVAQIGQSLDGRVATASGELRGINGDAALDHLHRIRAHVDAVVVGAGTVVADDPRLTVRRVAGANPARVAIDPRGRLGCGGRWLARDGAARLLVSAAPCRASVDAELVRLDACDGRISPPAIVAALFARGHRRLLIEGGPKTIAGFIEAGCVDRLHVLISPVIIGSGRTGFELSAIAKLEMALRPRAEIHLLGGGDILFDCDLRRGFR